MQLLRILLGEGAVSFLKVFVMAGYSAWAFKLGVIDADTNPLFALIMVLLSIYGLWVIIRNASARVLRTAEGNPGGEPVR